MKQIVDRELTQLWVDDARLQPRHFEQAVQHPAQPFQRRCHHANQVPGFRIKVAPLQHAEKQRGGLNRLAQVVAGRRQKPRFVGVGAFRFVARGPCRFLGPPPIRDVDPQADHPHRISRGVTDAAPASRHPAHAKLRVIGAVLDDELVLSPVKARVQRFFDRPAILRIKGRDPVGVCARSRRLLKTVGAAVAVPPCQVSRRHLPVPGAGAAEMLGQPKRLFLHPQQCVGVA